MFENRHRGHSGALRALSRGHVGYHASAIRHNTPLIHRLLQIDRLGTLVATAIPFTRAD
jgi:hypothetical protein